MYIRSRDEALDALAETLRLPERRTRLIDVTVKIVVSLHPDARQILCDAQALLVEGGLDELARQRREMLGGQEPILIINEEEERLFDAVGRALDAGRIARVAAGVFRSLEASPLWLVARAVLANDDGARSAVSEAVRARGTPEEPAARAAAEKRLAAWIEQARPAWFDRAPALRAACEPVGGADLLLAVAADDARAARVLDLTENSPSEAGAELARIAEIVQTIRRLENERKDESGMRRVA